MVVGIACGGVGNSSSVTTNQTPIYPTIPPPKSSGYEPPKKNPNPSKVPNPNGKGKGWPSKDGGVWVPNNKQHGGPGWTEQFPDGTHRHRYPDGHIREATVSTPIDTSRFIGVGLVATGGAIGVYTIVNDITGFGVLDDGLLAPAGALINEGRLLLFS